MEWIWQFLLVYIAGVSTTATPWGVLLAIGWVFFPQALWAQAVSALGWNIWIVASFVSPVVYFLNGGIFLCMDLTHKPSFLYKYKLQPNRPFDRSTLSKLLLNLAGGLVVITQAAWWLLVVYLSPMLRPYGFGIYVDETLPDTYTLFTSLMMFVAVEETLFFYGHWLLHKPSLYPRIHKIHHEYKAPIALAAAYSHPVEMFVSNIGPVLIGPMLCGSHLYTLCGWMVFAILGTQMHHSGYRFPWVVGHEPDFHDYHHEAFTCNFGLLGVFDWLHGTDKAAYLAKRKRVN
eukprot:TRINITY_DN62038_c0_g1_i1.p1 TRINITY_DN62038_c0_g1~~TRINITY_DN62038_c0_g1_i1.p1  ORF type:complete len:289 (-),score=14.52 TRINITY_DN62038_c0_g1_i1:393-1259(-)